MHLARRHIDHVRKERLHYRSILNEAKTLLKGMFTNTITEEYYPLLSRPLGTLNIKSHYSFDYAQQVISIPLKQN